MIRIQYNDTSKRLCALLATLGLATACSPYSEVNTEPYTISRQDMQTDGYTVVSATNEMQQLIVPVDVNACQFTEALLGGAYGGYLADANSGFNSKNFAQFVPEAGWNKVLYVDFMPRMTQAYQKIITTSDDLGIKAMARILRVALAQRITDAYGPIPFSQVGTQGKLTAELDSQEEVYRLCFKELDEAIQDLQQLPDSYQFPHNTDLLLGGDYHKWIHYAGSLRLRMAMRLVYADETLARKEAEKSTATLGLTMEGNQDNVKVSHFGKDGNPLNVATNVYNGSGDSRVSADISRYLVSYRDPRASLYMKPSSINGNPYIGYRIGAYINTQQAQRYSQINIASNSPLYIMVAAETAFLKAEASLRGWTVAGGKSAQEWYEQGIKLSFEQWGAQGVDKYLRSTQVLSGYSTPDNDLSYSGNSSQATPAWQSNAGFELNLEQIITQKWIANFPLGLEAWAEYRRTAYPRLMPSVVNKSSSQDPINPELGARRLRYPIDELSTNGANIKVAVARYLGGKDLMSTRLWWDKKKTNN